ncbi:WD40 repeat-like protein [Coniophora puteana RWD-64-598 SS2]|uniref:WD40 repeat-like protein n=1 Tax=Coniophora puteana (strain RWD-64-598) TaxID=741705 RepID=A0A5M3M8N1_CONPW|nr:WD40 repeat-like protein [Coniophora puteana RWD-64-598 SS2]EIW75622.1 WD40 repeat-like protein [Coniophora puteana RWD-64-598 SS2]
MEKTTFGPFKGHTDGILCLAYSPDGAFLATGSDDNMIRIWETSTGLQNGEVLKGHTSHIHAIDYSPDGQHLVSGSHDHSIRVWDTNTHQTIMGPLKCHNLVHSVKYSPDGAFIASGDHDGLKLWAAHTGNSVATYVHPRRINSVSFSPSGEHVATACRDRFIRIFTLNVSGLELSREISGHTSSVTSIQYSPDGSVIASASEDYTISLWNSHSGERIRDPLHHNGGHEWIWAIDISRIDSLASGAEDGIICIWDLQCEDTITKRLFGHDGRVRAVKFTPDSTRLVSGGDDETIRVWDVQSGASLQVWNPHDRPVVALSISSDGSRLASGSGPYGSYYSTTRVWDVNSYEAIGGPLQHDYSVLSVCLSPDGSKVLSGSDVGAVRLWDISRGEQDFIFKHEEPAKSVQFSLDGSRFLSASEGGRVCVWSASTRELHRTMHHGSSVGSAAFSPDGISIMSGTKKGDARLWDVSSGSLLLPQVECHAVHSCQN